jgi:hypothetical protein
VLVPKKRQSLALSVDPDLVPSKFRQSVSMKSPLTDAPSAPPAPLAMTASESAAAPLGRAGGSFMKRNRSAEDLIAPESGARPAPTPKGWQAPVKLEGPGGGGGGKGKEDKRLKGIRMDEHLVEAGELERRLKTSLQAGLAAAERERRRRAEGANVWSKLPSRRAASEEARHDLEYYWFTDALDAFPVLVEGALRLERRSGLVRGDVVLLRGGQEVPADLRVLEASNDLAVDLTNLTSQSRPAPRSPHVTAESPLESPNMLWHRTWLASGWCRALVINTGPLCLLHRLTGAIESVTWVQVTPPLLQLHHRCMCNHSLFLKRLEALPVLATAGILVADEALFLARRWRVASLIYDGHHDLPLPSPESSTRPSATWALLQRAVALASPVPPLPPSASTAPPQSYFPAPGGVGAGAGVGAGGAGPAGDSLDAVLLEQLQVTPHAYAQAHGQFHTLYSERGLSVHACPNLRECLLLRNGPAGEVLRACGSLLVDGREQRLEERVRQRLQRRVRKLHEAGVLVLAFAQRVVPREALPPLPGPEAATRDPRIKMPAELVGSGFALVGLVGLSDQLQEGAGEALQRLTSQGLRLLLCSERPPAYVAHWAGRLGLPLLRVVEPADMRDLHPEEWTHVCYAAMDEPAKLALLRELQQRKQETVMYLHEPQDGWAYRAADATFATASSSYMSKVVSDFVFATDRFSTVVDSFCEVRAAKVQMQDVKLLDGGPGVTLTNPNDHRCVVS